jgi:hypothetical protein
MSQIRNWADLRRRPENQLPMRNSAHLLVRKDAYQKSVLAAK